MQTMPGPLEGDCRSGYVPSLGDCHPAASMSLCPVRRGLEQRVRETSNPAIRTSAAHDDQVRTASSLEATPARNKGPKKHRLRRSPKPKMHVSSDASVQPAQHIALLGQDGGTWVIGCAAQPLIHSPQFGANSGSGRLS